MELALFTEYEQTPIQAWRDRLSKNGLPAQTIEQLVEMAEQWLSKLQKNSDLTPDDAFQLIEQSCRDRELLKYFERYKFALFELVKESDLTK
jgi:hypothetical protein